MPAINKLQSTALQLSFPVKKEFAASISGAWLFGADGGPGGGLSSADGDTVIEIPVTPEITDA